MKHCNSENLGKMLGIGLVPETPFEKGMSISTHQQKRVENAEKILSNVKESLKNKTLIIVK